MRTEYAAPIPGKPHVLHVGLRVTTPQGDMIQEVPVRRSIWESLPNDAARLSYARDCAEYHHPAPGAEGMARRAARRAAWDEDDQRAAAARWVAEPLGREGGQVRVRVSHEGLTVEVLVPADTPDPAAAIRAAWQVEWDKRQAEQQALAAFAMDA